VDFPGSTPAYREYDAELSEELRVSLAFTRCDRDDTPWPLALRMSATP